MPPSEIKKLIKKVGAKTAPANTGDLSEDLKNRLDSVELLIEKLGQTELLVEAATNYFNESKQELTHLKYYRLATIAVSAVVLLFLLGLLVCVIFYHQFWFFMQGQVTRSSIILGTLTGSIILMTVILRGVFRSASDRSGIIPLKQVIMLQRTITNF